MFSAGMDMTSISTHARDDSAFEAWAVTFLANLGFEATAH
jgi:hypothetical protein